MSPPAASSLYPLLLTPRFERRVWGGGRLPEWLAAPPPVEAGIGAQSGKTTPVGEAWLAGDDSQVLNGPLRGRTLASLVSEYGAALIGAAPLTRYGARMPLLVKILDISGAISLQVHPSDTALTPSERGASLMGKSEAWYVLAAEPSAALLWGFKRNVTPLEVREAAESGELSALLNPLTPTVGSVIVNPAGRVHGASGGLLLYEIQQASDVTYRLHDPRTPAPGAQRRELHITESLLALDLTASRPEDAHAGGGAPLPAAATLTGTVAGSGSRSGFKLLVERPEFELSRALLEPGSSVAVRVGSPRGRGAADSLEVLTMVSGEAVLTRVASGEGAGLSAHDWAPVELSAGASVLLPASLLARGAGYELSGEGEVLRGRVPSPQGAA